MAVRVQNSTDLIFGVLAAETTITAIRFQKAGAAPTTKRLAAAVTVPLNQQLRIATGDFDVVYPSGDLSDVHMKAVVDAYWDEETFQIDAMTGADGAEAVVTTSGYAQQTHSAWDIATEAD